MRLWAGQTISLIGSAVTSLALPLTAVLVLEATPIQMGILTAAGTAPSLLIGLFAGVWADRWRRRPILIAADLGRAALLMVIPLTALLGVLRIEYLYVIAFLVGGLSMFFSVAYRSFLPALVGREWLLEGNSKLEISHSAAQMAGPGLAGGLVQLLTAPVAIVANVLSYLVSALFLGLIQAPERVPPIRDEQQQGLWQEIAQGLGLVASNQFLRPLVRCLGTLSLFNAVVEAVFMLYLVRQLGLEAGLLGFILSVGGAGFLVGALLPGQVARRFGLGRTIIGAMILVGLSDLLIPLAGGPLLLLAAILLASEFFFGVGFTIFHVAQVSLRQGVTPDDLQGRMNATMGVVFDSFALVGGLLGGVLGQMIGLRLTLLVAVCGELLAALWLLLSPVRSLREQPSLPE